MCYLGELQRKKVFVLVTSRDCVFSLLTICASPSPDILGHGEHGWRQNVAPLVWMNACGNQLYGRGLRITEQDLGYVWGWRKPVNWGLGWWLRFSWIYKAVHILCCDICPKGKGCHIRQMQKTEEYVQLRESGARQTGLWWGFLT